MKGRTFLLFASILLFTLTMTPAQSARKWKPTPPRSKYGNVVMGNISEKKSMSPVVFNHWLHRALYTCRLCHIDIGFAMEADGTGITEEDNKNGLYCGACHNGKEAFGPEIKNLSEKKVTKNCDRCHSYGKKVKFEKDFYKFTKHFPRVKYGNGLDWIKAEDTGMVELTDYLKNFSVKADTLKYSTDIDFNSKIQEMPDIIFSHEKHTIWNGCALCHPAIFGIKKGLSVYSMKDIVEGKYCGVCHGKVAFPNLACKSCHVKEVH